MKLSWKELKQHHENHLAYHKDSLGLFDYQSRGNPLLAQLDFHMLMPLLFPAAGNGSGRLLSHMKHWLPDVLEHQTEHNIQFFLTWPTLLEYLDQLQHQCDTAGEIYTNQIMRVMQGKDFDESLLAAGTNLRVWLAALTEPGYREAVERPITQFLDWVDRGLLRGIDQLGGLPSGEILRNYSGIAHSDYLEHRHRRLQKETARSELDSRFHYKVDAANMAISRILRQEAGCDLYIFTNTPSTIELMDGLARHYWSLATLTRPYEDGDSRDERILRLNDAIQFLNTNLKRIEEHTSVVTFSPYLRERLECYLRVISPGIFPMPKHSPTLTPDLLSEIRPILKNKKLLADRKDRALTELRAGAKRIAAQVSSRLRRDTWEEFDFSDDQIYQRIRKNFALN